MREVPAPAWTRRNPPDKSALGGNTTRARPDAEELRR